VRNPTLRFWHLTLSRKGSQMILALAALIGLTQFQSAPVNELQLPTIAQSYAGPATIGGYFNNAPRIDMRSPVSGSVIVAQAIRAGRIRIPYPYLNRPQPSPCVLTCSPVPFPTPNVQASEGTRNPDNETPIASNPMQPRHLLTGANDYNCGSLQGFFASNDGGTTWNHTCMNLLSG